MEYNKVRKENKEMAHTDSFYRKMAAVFFALCLYLMGVIACHFDEIGAPWNFIAILTLGVCNGLLSIYFYGDPETEDGK